LHISWRSKLELFQPNVFVIFVCGLAFIPEFVVGCFRLHQRE
jgi:hypothetical protein